MPSISGTALRECKQLRDEAKAHMNEFEKLRRQADAILTSGAPARYHDVRDFYEEECAKAETEYLLAMKLYRAAHGAEHFERMSRTA